MAKIPEMGSCIRFIYIHKKRQWYQQQKPSRWFGSNTFLRFVCSPYRSGNLRQQVLLKGNKKNTQTLELLEKEKKYKVVIIFFLYSYRFRRGKNNPSHSLRKLIFLFKKQIFPLNLNFEYTKFNQLVPTFCFRGGKGVLVLSLVEIVPGVLSYAVIFYYYL